MARLSISSVLDCSKIKPLYSMHYTNKVCKTCLTLGSINNPAIRQAGITLRCDQCVETSYAYMYTLSCLDLDSHAS